MSDPRPDPHPVQDAEWRDVPGGQPPAPKPKEPLFAPGGLKFVIAFIVGLAGSATSVHAEMTAQQVVDGYRSGSTRDYLAGLADGISWLAARPENVEKTYCPPPSLPIVLDQFHAILSKAIEDVPRYRTNEAGFVLIAGLRRTFPCPGR